MEADIEKCEEPECQLFGLSNCLAAGMWKGPGALGLKTPSELEQSLAAHPGGSLWGLAAGLLQRMKESPGNWARGHLCNFGQEYVFILLLS